MLKQATYYVEVSFSDPINHGALTYHLPENRDIPPLGSRALVYVKNRRLIGYVTKISTEKPPFKTAPLGKLIDESTLFSPEMLKLARLIAKDCVCSVGEVLHAMLPSGIKLKKEGTGAKPKIIRVLKLNSDSPIYPEHLTPKEKLVIEALLRCSSAPTAAYLSREAKVSQAPINQLKKKGVLQEIEERVERQVADDEYYNRPTQPPPKLSAEQEHVLDVIRQSYNTDKKPVLIRGVTCSGKTEVYLRWVAEIIAQNRTAIVLVPEIALTPQMMKRFKERFQSQAAILHSRLSAGERYDQWQKIKDQRAKVVVGARSAIFAPVSNLGTIILDEEGEASFKQSDSPRYHAREAAIHRCRLENALLVMGSATPTIDSFYNCSIGKYRLAEMNNRVSNRVPPRVTVVDMRKELVVHNNRSIFSRALTNAIAAALKAKKQAILFLNRRGYSNFVFCRECGEAVQCSKCRVSLVYHSGSQIMRCHYCGEMQPVPQKCPSCGSSAIKFFGAGTQRVESEAKRYFPNARIQRLDSDTVTTKGSMEAILDRFGEGKTDILIGTQMVAKGLDFPNVTLVGVLAADSLLKLPDFRASERNFSLLAQVSGRAGRGDSPGEVILQTYDPNHHSIQCALTEDYHGFYAKEAAMRKENVFPPFIELAYFIVSSTDQELAKEACQALRVSFEAQKEVDKAMLFGPSPAAIEKINDRYRFQLMLKMADFDTLTSVVKKTTSQFKKTKDLRLSIDINPFM